MPDVTSALPLRFGIKGDAGNCLQAEARKKTVSNDVVSSRFAPDNRARVSGKKQRAAALVI